MISGKILTTLVQINFYKKYIPVDIGWVQTIIYIYVVYTNLTNRPNNYSWGKMSSYLTSGDIMSGPWIV